MLTSPLPQYRQRSRISAARGPRVDSLNRLPALYGLRMGTSVDSSRYDASSFQQRDLVAHGCLSRRTRFLQRLGMPPASARDTGAVRAFDTGEEALAFLKTPRDIALGAQRTRLVAA